MKTLRQDRRANFAAHSTAFHVAIAVALAASATGVFAADVAPAVSVPLPVAIVNTLNKISSGPHAGYRANHAKGVLVEGSFMPASGADSLSTAAHFATSVPVVVRFSNGTGFQAMADADANASPHGMAIRFKLPDGTSTDIVSISANSFPVATPEEFLGLLQAVSTSGPTAAKPSPIEQFMGSHPVALKWAMTPRPAPASFGTLAYFGVNSFKFTNAKGEAQYARYQIIPVTNEPTLNEADTAKAMPNYLMDEMPRRIAKAPVKFRLVAQLAQADDQVNDATIAWPASRKLVELGVISLTSTASEQVKNQKALLFNPVSLPAGIEPSADPILLARFPAYAVSFGQRAQ